MELFDQGKSVETKSQPPLAARMRPRTLEEIAGQEHLLAPGKLLRRAIESDRLGSIILYGPPGCGKTSLAEVIALLTSRHFEKTSGVLANVSSMRKILNTAFQRKKRNGEETILFIDEIHHFNKSQQDILLPYVEEGHVILIGATIHNPFFFINSPLTSRSQIFELEPLAETIVLEILKRSLKEKRGLGTMPTNTDEDALLHLAKVCEGDARRALNALEVAVLTTPAANNGRIHITRPITEDSIQKKAVVYDRDDDGHYDTISAFIKSVRGSDPHAAVYWLAKMLYAGEDPRFIARRIIILASEDIGNADPRGLLLAVAAKDAVEFVGMPEARIILAHIVTYLATAPKSNASYLAIEKALSDVKEGKVLPVPKPLRGANYAGAKNLGHTGYKYAHDYKNHFVDQEYMPSTAVYYEPTLQGYEETILKRMERLKKIRDDKKENGSKKTKPNVPGTTSDRKSSTKNKAAQDG